MACYHPLEAYRTPGGGKLSFKEGGDAGQRLALPCGRCIGCRTKQTQDWTVRLMHEGQMHRDKSFITLTYDDPWIYPGLDYTHFQKFIRKNRDEGRKIRYFVAGEYGAERKRPHWHAIIYGTTYGDRQKLTETLYRSAELEKLWPHGFSSVGDLTWQSAGYVAAYCTKKLGAQANPDRYTRVDLMTGELIQIKPEFARMSLKPGIGEKWYQKYKNEVHYARDAIVKPGGMTLRPPRYYDKILAEENKNRAIEIETDRQITAIEREKDNTTERLKVRETVAIAKQKQKQRKL